MKHPVTSTHITPGRVNLGGTVHCPGGCKARDSQQHLVGKGGTLGSLKGTQKGGGLGSAAEMSSRFSIPNQDLTWKSQWMSCLFPKQVGESLPKEIVKRIQLLL